MLNFAFSLQQIVTSPLTQDRHSGVSVLPSDWLLVHQCSEVPANKHKANQPLIWLRLFSFCSCLHSNDDVDDSIKSQFWEKLCVYVKTVYLFVWSRANCNLQLCKTLLQLCNLQRRNTVNNNAPSDPHTHTHTHTFPALLPFINEFNISLMRWKGNMSGNKCKWNQLRRSSSVPWPTRWISPALACCAARTEPLRPDL